jgi:multidrug resistance protein, MATE family
MSESSMFKAMYAITAIALPVSTAGIINMASIFIPMMMVARLGPEQFAAGALAVTTYITIKTVIVTIFYAVGILISHRKGQQSTHIAVGLILKNGIWLAIFVAFPAALALWYADKLLLLVGQEPRLVAITRDYFHYAALGMFPLLISTVISQFFIGTDRPRLPLLLALINLPMTMFVAYVFVFGRFSMPMLGLAGIALASMIAQSFILLYVLLLLFMQNTEYQLFRVPFLPDLKMCQTIFKLGLPIGIQSGGESAAITLSTYLMGYFGIIALAAMNVANQYSLFVVMVSVGLTQALSVLVSKAYGQKDINLIKMYFHAAMIIFLACFIVVGLLFCLFPHYLILFFFGKDPVNSQIMHLGSIFFIITAFVLFIDGIRNLISSVQRGLHDSRSPMRIGIITIWLISLPISYLVGFTLHGGPIGLRTAFISGFVIAVVIQWRRLRYTFKSIANHI